MFPPYVWKRSDCFLFPPQRSVGVVTTAVHNSPPIRHREINVSLCLPYGYVCAEETALRLVVPHLEGVRINLKGVR